MPKPIISVEKKRVNKLKEIICGRMAVKKLSGTKIAKMMFMKTRTFNYKLENMTFKPEELISLFFILEIGPDDLTQVFYQGG